MGVMDYIATIMKFVLPEFVKAAIKKSVLEQVDRETPKKYGCPVCGSKVSDFKLLYEG